MGEVFALQPPVIVPEGQKQCPACQAIKATAEFGGNRTMRDGLQFYCKSCTAAKVATWRRNNPDKEKANQARYYRQHKDAYRQRRLAWRRSKTAQLVAMLKAAPCMDCTQSFPSCVMDFDHRPGEVKAFDLKVPNMVRYTLETVMLEVAKCDLVCANCHRLRTRNRRVAGGGS